MTHIDNNIYLNARASIIMQEEDELSLGDFRRIHAAERDAMIRSLQAKYPTLKPGDVSGIADRHLYHKHEYGGHSGHYDTDKHAQLRVQQYAHEQLLRERTRELHRLQPDKPLWQCQMLAQAALHEEAPPQAPAVVIDVDASDDDL